MRAKLEPERRPFICRPAAHGLPPAPPDGRCELDYLDPRLGLATRLAVEEPGTWHWMAYRAMPEYNGVPFPSVVRLESVMMSGVPWSAPRHRVQLVAASFNVRGSGFTLRLRASLKRTCLADKRCAYMSAVNPRPGSKEAGPQHIADSTAVKAEAPLLAISRLYWHATFCLQPTGDAVSRKAVIDALLLGCIPVLFHPGQAAQWPWHWGAWQANATVLLNGSMVARGRLDPVAALAAIPPSRVTNMQRTIARHAHTMQYSLTDAHGLAEDAFDVVLREAWVRARDMRRWTEGRKLQLTASATDSALAQFAREPPTHRGYCAATADRAGDCKLDASGSWRVGVAGGLVGRASSVVGLDECTRRCEACERCRYVSLSHEHAECSWYAKCDLQRLRLDNGGWSYRSRSVIRQETPE